MRRRTTTREDDGLRTLTPEETRSCLGGGLDPLKGMFDWILGNPPAPGQWPPEKL
jgi:hypothetical protein